MTILDEGTGEHWQYRADERFPMASTFKTLVCAMLLYRIDRGQEKLERTVRFNRHYTDFKESGSCIAFQGLNCNRKLCKPQAIAITVSLNPFSPLRCYP